MNAQNGFRGPLFVMGLPRSGTKLLGALLNRHPRINLPLAESHFIPYYIRRFGPDGPRDRRSVLELLSDWKRTTFYRNLRTLGPDPEAVDWPGCLPPGGWPAFFKDLLGRCAPKPYDPELIWGDRTPGAGYLKQIDLFLDVFPGCRVVHILRDPRDRAASVRRAWGMSPLRSAHVWRTTVERASRGADRWSGSYREIRYEDLIGDPEEALRGICSFLGLEFTPDMLRLDSPIERLHGRGLGATEILSDNVGRWGQSLTPRQVRRIEEETAESMRTRGYDSSTIADKHAPRWLIICLGAYDGCARLIWYVRHMGILRGAGFYWQFLKRGLTRVRGR